MLLSFIIPAYNASSTILGTLDSIYKSGLNQNVFEIIVVDDCSTDNTRDLVSKYAISHNEVCLLCQKQNHRQGAARNRGLEVAKGEYISFVDSDDVILKGIVTALQLATQHKVDLVYCSCYHEKTPTEVVLKCIDMDEHVVMSGVEFCEHYQHEGVFWYPWGILFRREWLVALSYPFIEDRQHEDRDWLAYVMSHAGTIANSKQPMYRYVCNPNSTCRMARYSTIFDHVASGIRHIDLSRQLMNCCPKLSTTLYEFGVDEIYRSIRLRNLTKFTWMDNKNLYDDIHLKPLLRDLRRVCQLYDMPIAIRFVTYHHFLTFSLTFIASPIASLVRKIKHK